VDLSGYVIGKSSGAILTSIISDLLSKQLLPILIHAQGILANVLRGLKFWRLYEALQVL
jgi:hypothetical protein